VFVFCPSSFYHSSVCIACFWNVSVNKSQCLHRFFGSDNCMDEIGGIGSFCCSRESTSEAVLQRERERESWSSREGDGEGSGVWKVQLGDKQDLRNNVSLENLPSTIPTFHPPTHHATIFQTSGGTSPKVCKHAAPPRLMSPKIHKPTTTRQSSRVSSSSCMH